MLTENETPKKQSAMADMKNTTRYDTRYDTIRYDRRV